MFGGDKKKADCPLWRGPCREHECRFWVQLLGKHPQTGQDINKWDCAIAFLPVLLVEGAQESRQTAAAVESFRNEMVRMNQMTHKLLAPPEDE